MKNNRKWCPMARVESEAVNVSINRFFETIDGWPKSCDCIKENCALWIPDDKNSYGEIVYHGKCGFRGKNNAERLE